MDYPHIRMFIDGKWIEQAGDPVVDPATEDVIGEVPRVTGSNSNRRSPRPSAGSGVWRDTAPSKRADTIRKAAQIAARTREGHCTGHHTRTGKAAVGFRERSFAWIRINCVGR